MFTAQSFLGERRAVNDFSSWSRLLASRQHVLTSSKHHVGCVGSLETEATASSRQSDSSFEHNEPTNSQQSVNASPVPHHRTLIQTVVKDSMEGGSDRDTDKEGSVTDDSYLRPRRPASIRRRALQSANSSNVVEQPMNSSPGQSPRRSSPLFLSCLLLPFSHFCNAKSMTISEWC